MSKHPANLVDDLAQAWNRHDMEAFSSLFEDEARFDNVVGMFWRSRDEIRGAHAHTQATIFEDSVLAVAAVEETALGPSLVALHAHWLLTGHAGPDGRPEAPRNGVLLLVARETESGGWKVAIAQNSDAIPGVVTRPQQA